jgi:predicted transcriptional regulator
LTFYTVSVVRAVPGGGPPGEGVVVLMVDGKVYMPFLWETAAFLALAVGYTAAAASLVALWRALGSSAEGVRRALEFYERRGGFLPDVYVVARILHALMGGPTPRSRLAAVARVNYRRFQEYLQFLAERGYVTDGEVVSLTPRGAEVAAELERLLSEVLGREDPFEKRRK